MDDDFLNHFPQEGGSKFLKSKVLSHNPHEFFRVDGGGLRLVQFFLQTSGAVFQFPLFLLVVCGQFHETLVADFLAVAAIVSAVLAAANGLRIYLQYHDSAIALVISLSLAATVVLAKLVGCMLPIAAKQLHMDPAIMASPLITTIVDAGAVLIYFQAAAALLRLPV